MIRSTPFSQINTLPTKVKLQSKYKKRSLNHWFKMRWVDCWSSNIFLFQQKKLSRKVKRNKIRTMKNKRSQRLNNNNINSKLNVQKVPEITFLIKWLSEEKLLIQLLKFLRSTEVLKLILQFLNLRTFWQESMDRTQNWSMILKIKVDKSVLWDTILLFHSADLWLWTQILLR